MTLKSLLSRLFPPQHGGALYAALAGAALLCILLFFVLQALPPRPRKSLIVFVTFISGLFYALEWFWPVNKKTDENPLTFAVPTVGNVLNVLAAFTLGLGIVSLIRVHGSNVARQRTGWENSLILLASMAVMTVVGLRFEDTMLYRSMFQDLLANFDAAMFASLAFYIIGAAYRAFRIRSAEATLLMAAALVVMLGQIPIGQYITHTLPEKGAFISLFRLDNISNWLLQYVNAPAQRAINFGLGIGLLAIGLRVWLSLERGAYFDAKVSE